MTKACNKQLDQYKDLTISTLYENIKTLFTDLESVPFESLFVSFSIPPPSLPLLPPSYSAPLSFLALLTFSLSIFYSPFIFYKFLKVFQLYYVDEDNDKIRVKLDLELSEALRYTQANNSILKIFVQSTFSPPPPRFLISFVVPIYVPPFLLRSIFTLSIPYSYFKRTGRTFYNHTNTCPW